MAVAAGIDRIIDMGRTVMSVTGDASCAVVMQKSVGQQQDEQS
ncbi:MAG: cation:dicarboxylase symporter family transporter [Prevotella sp.]|nr:cation:dicarboxylase symporter family transporter [Prevotella sp.]